MQGILEGMEKTVVELTLGPLVEIRVAGEDVILYIPAYPLHCLGRVGL